MVVNTKKEIAVVLLFKASPVRKSRYVLSQIFRTYVVAFEFQETIFHSISSYAGI